MKKCPIVKVDSVSKMRVFAVSDIHTDFRGNMKWLEELVSWGGNEFRNDVIIIAGDISHDLGIIETTFTLFQQCFGYVFHVCGNHELWVAPLTETVRDGYEKCNEILEICEKLGVFSHAVVFEDRNKGCDPLIVVPLLSWYEPQFVGSEARKYMKEFDCACRWTEHDQVVTTKFLQFNVPNIEFLSKTYNLSDCKVVTCSHFLPRKELFYGWPALQEVMGSKRIDDQLRLLKSKVHVFGHSHLNYDATIENVRYVQHALGSESFQRTTSSFPSYKPKELTLK